MAVFNPTANMQVTISATGLNLVTYLGVAVMQGSLGLADGGPYLSSGQNTSPTTPGAASAQSIGSITSTGCVVTQTFGPVGVSDAYTIAAGGEDIIIARTLTNNGTGTLHVANNTLPNTLWAAEPQTDMQEQPTNWWPSNGGYTAFNPSTLNRFGCWSAVQPSYGPVNFGLGYNTVASTTCQNAVTMDNRTGAASRAMNWLERVELAASASVTITLTIRVSAANNLFHLFVPYQTSYQAAFQLQYTPNDRTCSKSVVAAASLIPTNPPYGYSNDMTTTAGVNFEIAVAGNLAVALGTSNIIWLWKGANAVYDIDPNFVNFPSGAASKIAGYVAALAALTPPITAGIAASPMLKISGGAAVRISMSTTPTADMITQLGYFTTAINTYGILDFYCDVSGLVPDDRIMFAYLRTNIGTTPLMWSEFWNSGTLPYAGSYVEMHWNGTNTGTAADYSFANGTTQQQIDQARWLLPGCGFLANIAVQPNSNLATQYAWMTIKRLTPLVADSFSDKTTLKNIIGPAQNQTTGTWGGGSPIYIGMTPNKRATIASYGMVSGRNMPFPGTTKSAQYRGQIAGLYEQPSGTETIGGGIPNDPNSPGTPGTSAPAKMLEHSIFRRKYYARRTSRRF